MNEDAIWNRALGFGGEHGNGEGDVALQNVLGFHSRIMNGGLLFALETDTPKSVVAAIAGYRWMGLSSAADAVVLVRDEVAAGALEDDASAEALEFKANDSYDAVVSDDSTIQAAFRTKLRESPSAFEGAQ